MSASSVRLLWFPSSRAQSKALFLVLSFQCSSSRKHSMFWSSNVGLLKLMCCAGGANVFSSSPSPPSSARRAAGASVLLGGKQVR